MGMTPTELAVEIAGFGGALLILGSYILLTIGKLTGQSRAYQAMNFVGAIGFIVNGFWHRAMPSAILNVIWAGIALVALAKISLRGSSTKE
jgi:hypothetical protein